MQGDRHVLPVRPGELAMTFRRERLLQPLMGFAMTIWWKSCRVGAPDNTLVCGQVRRLDRTWRGGLVELSDAVKK